MEWPVVGGSTARGEQGSGMAESPPPGYATHLSPSVVQFERTCRRVVSRQHCWSSYFSPPETHLVFCVLLQYLVEALSQGPVSLHSDLFVLAQSSGSLVQHSQPAGSSWRQFHVALTVAAGD